MTEREWFQRLYGLFPVLDPSWSSDVQALWRRCFVALFRWSCRLTVEAAIDRFVREWQPEGSSND